VKPFVQNVHPIERVVRVVLGLVLVSLVFVGPATSWGLIGLVPLLTGIAGTCPAYSLFGFSTCSAGEPRQPRQAS